MKKTLLTALCLLSTSGMTLAGTLNTANSDNAQLVQGPNNFVTCAKYDAMVDTLVNNGVMTKDEADLIKCVEEFTWNWEWSVNTWGYYIHQDDATTYTLRFKGDHQETAERFKQEIDTALNSGKEELFQIRIARNPEFSNIVSITSVSDIKRVSDSPDEDGVRYHWDVTITTNQEIIEPADNWIGSMNFYKFKMAAY
ncbi:hypothetical protein [Vibrio sagamiensis]|uniref:Lipoprotein n=1 Tax=Vibrio sagamiensis NBRC 104589 TaxID=1219064 RepID=A0A511QAE9_9VIBR|nr:hypothetical protein [Vibrio sagamiensis]PNQ71945.1 hypothetical protein C1141_00015 [Vibrio agarivorans]GEM74273.1 hypothetical protein VSA01S_03850 [Vibrio sagamiensis NBRC 104589]